MPLNKQTVSYFDFVRGLNTEVSPLAAEPNDILDMDNVTIHFEKALSVRNGFEFLGTKSDGTIYETSSENFSTFYGVFNYPSNNFKIFNIVTSTGNKKFVIVKIGSVYRIYNYATIATLQDIDQYLFEYSTFATTNPEAAFYQSKYAAVKNKLFVSNPKHLFGFFEYDIINDTFVWSTVTPKIRSLLPGAPADTVANYQGFAYRCIQGHSVTAANVPGTGTDWESYWVKLGEIITGEGITWDSIRSADTNVAMNSTTQDLSGNPVTEWTTSINSAGATAFYESSIISINSTPNFAICTLAGQRLWLAGNQSTPNTIYISQTIIEGDEYDKYYQFADPKNNTDSAIVDTDGTTITIQDISKINEMISFKNGVLIFSDEGVWYIGGTSAGFTPNSYVVIRVSDDGCVSPFGVALVENVCVYLGTSSVYVITLDDLGNSPGVQSITDENIKTLYSQIPYYSKQQSQLIYDPALKEIRILTLLETQSWWVDGSTTKQPSVYRDILIYNVRLKAWYKHSITEDADGSLLYFANANVVLGGDLTTADVIDNSGNSVISEASQSVVSFAKEHTDESRLPLYLLSKKSGNTVAYAFGVLGTNFYQDFVTSASDVQDYDAFFTTAYQIFKDVAHKKQAPYIYPVFKRIESGIIDDVTQEDITPGSCLLRVAYDFAVRNTHTKYGEEREIYLPYRTTYGIFDGSLPGTDVVTSKIKLRGRGQALQLTFTKNGAKGFYLYGFQLELTASART